ncbi:MAG: FAD binding domain-containing protein [Deltaproteobacteria bacterium]|nr:FAD binding domain-containing protein [Deltaproteobacteria bacterium]
MSRYHAPTSLAEALEILAGDDVRVVAGGTDLMIQFREARLTGGPLPATVLDVNRLPELARLELTGDEPYVGAGLTYHFLETDPAVARVYPLLAQAAAGVGSVQVRHTGTLGGNAANASPAGDGVTALTALGARAEIASARGRRVLPLPELILAPNRNALAPDELILGFFVDRLPAGAGQAFAKVGRRQAVAIARLNLAVALDPDLAEPRVVLGASFPSPRRLAPVEELLTGGEPGPALWRAAGQRAAAEFVNVCGWRSSAPYKVPAVEHMLAATLAEAWEKAGGAA